MSRHLTRTFLLVFVVSAVAAGCGDDEGDPSDDGGVANGDGGRDGAIDANIADAAIPDATATDAPAVLLAGDPCDQSGDAGLGCSTGLLCCKPCCDGRPAVCTPPVTNTAGIGIGQCPLPDLRMETDRLQAEVGIGGSTFTTAGCSVQEGCVDAAGNRKLLHFSVMSSNIGTSDLVLGDPTQNPSFAYSMCHDHYHFSGYAIYRLLDSAGVEVMVGRKKAFCLEDFERMDLPPLGARTRARYTCANQGISMGWADTYANGLTCQFMDVTDVPPGTYTLEVTVNPDRFFEELDYSNNTSRVSITIPASNLTDPTTPCVGIIEGTNRECGWTNGGMRTCVPGTTVNVGCGSRCGYGTCSGDTMMRVCDGATPCLSPGLGANDDCNGATNCSAVRFTCPASGTYTTLWSPFVSNATVTCNIAASQ